MTAANAAHPVDPDLIRALHDLLGDERCLAGPARLLAYECDGLTHFKQRPAAVVLPVTTSEVQAIVRLCARHRAPIVPRGAGTCLSGGATPHPAGIVVGFARMNRILAIDPDNRVAVVQPGVVNSRLSEAAAPHGLAYAPDPSSQAVCTLGGNVAENAGGPHCLKHGATTNHVLALEVVGPDGTVRNLGSAVPGGAGLDLRGVVVGSEGTLGIVTAITCRLVPVPQRVETLLASFRDLTAACRAVSDIVAAGIVPAALEALDERALAAVEASVYRAGYPQEAGAVLIVELDGHPAQVASEARRAERILAERDALAVESAEDEAHRQRLWKGRKGAFGAMGRLAPDLYVQDVVVPRSRLPEVIAAVGGICDELGLRLSNVFHAGDGNLHPNISYDGRDPDETARVMQAGRRIIETCLEAGGSLSGEHGIGTEKREFMHLQFGEDDLLTFARVRATFDPAGLLNPGKVLPTRTCADVRRALAGGDA